MICNQRLQFRIPSIDPVIPRF